MSRLTNLRWVTFAGILSLGIIGAVEPLTLSRGAAALPLSVPQENTTQHYRLDPRQSTFIAHALRGGLLWFKGHDHLVAAREFSGEAQLNPVSLAAS